MPDQFVSVNKSEMVLLRVIPHTSVLNSSNRKLWRILHDLLAVDDPLSRRLSRDGLRLTYRLRDSIWWVVTMRAEVDADGAHRSLEFYCLVPAPFAEVFIAKIRTHEQWRRCTVQEVAPSELGLPEGDDVEAWSLKLARHDMFSLAIDYSRQMSPIRDLMLVSRELDPGDTAALALRLEAVGRRRWQSMAEWVWDEWNAGRVPQRRALDPSRLWRTLWQGFSTLAQELKALADDVMRAVELSFFPAKAGQDSVRPAALQLPDPERQALLVNGALAAETHHKANLPVFRADLLALIRARTPARRLMLAHSVASAFSDLAGDNRLQPIQVRLHYVNDGPFRLPTYWERDPNLLSTDEVGRLVQLPTADVQEEFRECLESNRSVEVEVPAPFRGESGLFAGTVTVKGTSTPVYVPMANLDMGMTPRVLIGSPRMGKDMCAVNWVVEAAIKHGHGAVVLDVVDERQGHRGMADAIRDHLPPEKVVDLNLGDYSHPIPITLDGVVSGREERIAADRLAKELMGFLLGDEGAEQHQTREYLRAVAKAAKGDLLGIKLLLTNDTYRQTEIGRLQKMGWDTTMLEELDGMQPGRRGQVTGPILVRLSEITEDEALRPMFLQRRRPETDLRRWLAESRVVVYRVPTGDLGESTVRLLAHWLAMTVFLTKLSMGAGNSPPTWFVLNEPHQYLSPGFTHFAKRMLAEGPKYRLAPLFLLHNLRQLPQDFVEVLMSSSLNWHLFKNSNAYVYDRLETYLAPTFTPQTAMQATQRFHFIGVWLDQTGEYQTPFLAAAPPLVWERYPTHRNEWLTLRHSRQYGRPFAEVEAEIQQRRRAYA